MTEEEKRKETIQKALQLKPEESAIVVIRNHQHNVIDQATYNVNDLGLLELLSNILIKTVRKISIGSNLSDAQELLGLKELLQTLEYEYKNHYLKKEQTHD